MRILLLIISLMANISLVSVDKTEAFSTNLGERPITTAKGEVGDLLRQWWAEGTAAGNVGDFYDNRDRGHSLLDMKLFPQLQKVNYTKSARKKSLDWGGSSLVFKHITVGNASTSAPPEQGGSNPRQFYQNTKGLIILYTQYAASNLNVYPEHHDHDIGRNGLGGGYGDLYPTNTPYLIISQGSSSSDKVFLKAVFHTLSAFRPEVKSLLRIKKSLMSTVQMIFRMSNRTVKIPADYLTGKAHPTVFEGRNVNILKMVKMAHKITKDALPPIVHLTVKEETKRLLGRDFFINGQAEVLCNTPAVIARIVRGPHARYRMVVSAEKSNDINRHPATFHWVVLRGNENKISIRPLNKKKSIVEITVPYPVHRGVPENPQLKSGRIDIGVFVDNGTYFSAPGFITFYGLADDLVTLDRKGRVVEISNGVSDPTIGLDGFKPLIKGSRYDISDYKLLLKAILRNNRAGALLRKAFKKSEVIDLTKLQIEIEKEWLKIEPLENTLKKSEAAMKATRKTFDGLKNMNKEAPERIAADNMKTAAEKAYKKAKQDFRSAINAASKILLKKRAALDSSPKNRLEKALNSYIWNPRFYLNNISVISDLMKKTKGGRSVANKRKELLAEGILERDENGEFRLSPILHGNAPSSDRLTHYEKTRLAWFHIEIISNLLCPGALDKKWKRNYVDSRLSVPREWRDVYRYDKKGRITGWTRIDRNGRHKDFTAHGHLAMEKDGRGRAIKAKELKYEVEWHYKGDKKERPKLLKQIPGGKLFSYTYNSEDDYIGTIKEIAE